MENAFLPFDPKVTNVKLHYYKFEGPRGEILIQSKKFEEMEGYDYGDLPEYLGYQELNLKTE